MRIIRISFILSLIGMLVAINTVYYFSTRETLIENQNAKVDIIIDTIINTVETNKDTEQYFNDFMGKDLRIASIAIANALPPSIKDVKNEELVVLSKELGLQGITLFKQKGDDIVGTKSSSPDQIGLSTKGWAKGMWYDMFHQLLTKHDVDLIPGFGERGKHFWSGPIDTSSANPNIVSKWGYYNDGSTDYLINPYMDDKSLMEYRKGAGVDKVIADAEKRVTFVDDVSVINGTALLNGERTTRDTGIVWESDKLKVFGDFSYQSTSDRKHVKKALEKGETVRQIVDVGDKKLLKTYYPARFKNGDNLDDQLVIVVASDFGIIHNELESRLTKLLLFSIVVVILGFLGLYGIIHTITKRERTIFNVQEMYTTHIQSLFKTVREQRHDANHHLYTIAGLLKLKNYDEINRYVEHLVKIDEPTRILVDVNIPAFSGLLQSKLSESKERDIDFEYHFENMEQLDLSMERITDLVRVTGNLLDNAFNAVESNPLHKERKVLIFGAYKNKELSISIQNNGAPIPEEDFQKIFRFGYTSRRENGGSGIGLASSKKLLERYGGALNVASDEKVTRFTIKMPISNKKIVGL